MEILKSGLEALASMGFISIVSCQDTEKGFEARISSGDKALTLSYDKRDNLSYVLPGEAVVAKKVSELSALKILASEFSFGDGQFQDHEAYPQTGLGETLKSVVFFPVKCSDLGTIYQFHDGRKFLHQGEDPLVSLVAYKAALDSGCETNFLLLASLGPVQPHQNPKSERTSIIDLGTAKTLASAKYPADSFSPESDLPGPVVSGEKHAVQTIEDKAYLSQDLELAQKVRSAAWSLLTRHDAGAKLVLASGLKEKDPQEIILVSSGTPEKPQTSVIFSSVEGYSVYKTIRPLPSVTTQKILSSGSEVKDFLNQTRKFLVKQPAEDVTRVASGAFYDIKASKVEAGGEVMCSVFDGVNVSLQPMTKILASLGLDKDFALFNRIRFVDFGRSRLQTPVFSAVRSGTDPSVYAAWRDGSLNAENYQEFPSQDHANRHFQQYGIKDPRLMDRKSFYAEQGASDPMSFEELQEFRRNRTVRSGTEKVPGGYENLGKNPSKHPHKFKNKKDADDQRKAMFEHGFKASGFVPQAFGENDDSFYADGMDEGLDDDFQDHPDEDDAFISPAGRLGGKTSARIGRKNLGEFSEEQDAIDAIKAQMEKDQFFPNIWRVSDHGNVSLVTSDKKFHLEGPVILSYSDDGHAVRKEFGTHRLAENFAQREGLNTYEILKSSSEPMALEGDPDFQVDDGPIEAIDPDSVDVGTIQDNEYHEQPGNDVDFGPPPAEGFEPSSLAQGFGDPERGSFGGGGGSGRRFVQTNWPRISSYITQLRERGIKSRPDILVSLQRRFPDMDQETAVEAYYQYSVAHQSAQPRGLHQNWDEMPEVVESEEGLAPEDDDIWHQRKPLAQSLEEGFGPADPEIEVEGSGQITEVGEETTEVDSFFQLDGV